MAKKKPRKYDPRRAALKTMNLRARECMLWRVNSATTDDGYFEVAGPFREQTRKDLMAHMSTTPNKWALIVIASFLSDDGTEYYEEAGCFELPKALTLTKSMREVAETLHDAIEHLKSAGNPRHYVEAHIAMYLQGSKLIDKHFSDEKLKDSAYMRSQSAFIVYDNLRG